MSDATETTGPTDSPVRSTSSVLLLLAGLVALPLVVLLVIVMLRGGTGSGGTGAEFADAIDDERIQAVYLASDEVFFGTIGDADGDVLVLRDAFFLRRTGAAAGDKDAEPADSLDLVSVATDVGGDGDLLINAAEIVRIQNLAADAEIAQSVEDAIK